MELLQRTPKETKETQGNNSSSYTKISGKNSQKTHNFLGENQLFKNNYEGQLGTKDLPHISIIFCRLNILMILIWLIIYNISNSDISNK